MIKSQRFYRYFLSYILLTVISLLIMSSVVYNQFLSTLRTEVEHSIINSLDPFRQAIDQRILEMDQMAMQISNNAQLKPFNATSSGYGAYAAVEELKQYLSTNMFISDIVIRYNGRSPEQLFAASGTYNAEMFFENIFQFENWNQYEFVKMSNTLNTAMMRPMDTVKLNQFINERYTTYFVPLIAGSDTPYGIVMFLIHERSFQDPAANVLGNYNGTLYILDSQGSLLYEYTHGNQVDGLLHATLDTIHKQQDTWNMTRLEHNKSDYTAVKHNAERRGYQYVAVMPSNQIMHKVNQAQWLFNLTGAVIFLIGVILAIILSVHHYRPLHKLVGVISKQNQAAHLQDPESSKTKDELNYISTAVIQMARENEGMIHQLHSQAIMLREQALRSLIKGKFKSREDWDNNLQFSSLCMEGAHFVVLLFLIDDYQTFLRNNTDAMQNYLKNSLIQILEELSKESGHGFGLELIDGRSIVFLFNLDEGNGKEEVLQQFAMKAKFIFQQYFRFTVTIGIGNIGNEITTVPQSFIARKKESKNVELLNQLKAYIHIQYKNHSLSLETISKHFDISQSYATRFFKDQTGDSLMRYVDGIRMNQAKQLLKSTDLKLQDIMNEVGYVDPTNFIRKFKNNEGITPIQYRNIMDSDT